MRTIYIVDDQEAVREALGEMLSVFGFEVETYRSAEAFLDIADSRAGGCIVADVRMEGMDGIALVHELAARGNGLPVILISGHADVPMAVSAIKSGAEDFIEKPVDDAKLVATINRAMTRASAEAAQRGSQAAVADAFARLTPRQVEIFDLVATGCTSQAIALRLDLSIRTVESYRAQVMEKMQAESVAVVVRQALKLGRIAP